MKRIEMLRDILSEIASGKPDKVRMMALAKMAGNIVTKLEVLGEKVLPCKKYPAGKK